MDARERAEKIGEAAYGCALKSAAPGLNAWRDSSQELRDAWIAESLAAVRAAYEIDGVRDLLDAVEASLVIYTDPSSYVDADHNLRAAAARVREAMGGQT